jgi:hypothetical protein
MLSGSAICHQVTTTRSPERDGAAASAQPGTCRSAAARSLSRRLSPIDDGRRDAFAPNSLIGGMFGEWHDPCFAVSQRCAEDMPNA